jgi:hypothetical protein
MTWLGFIQLAVMEMGQAEKEYKIFNFTKMKDSKS